MSLSNWLQLGDIGQVDYIFKMLFQPAWAILTLLSILFASIYMKRDPAYFWAFFIGFWSAFAGAFVLFLQCLPHQFIHASLHYPLGMEGWDTCAVILGGAALLVQGWLIIQKQVLVFALLSLLTFNPLIWVFNASYTLFLLNREKQVQA